MRRRISRTLFTAAAAGVSITTLAFAAASPAGAARHNGKTFTPNGTVVATNAQCTVTPLPSDNCGMAGYQGSGRDFRFAQALINVPNHVGHSDPISGNSDPTLYVALDDSSTNTYEYARVGLAPCSDLDDFIIPGVTFAAGTTLTACPASGWVVFDAVVQPTSAPTINVTSLSGALLGDGVLVQAYLSANGNEVDTTITLPTGTVIQHVIPVNGPTYTKAQALADWTTALESDEVVKPQPSVPAEKIRDAQFFQGRFTTVSGSQGTFNGPWTLTAFEGTSNGTLPPTGTLIGQPSYLWNDGNGFNGMGNDAFGVWRFPF